MALERKLNEWQAAGLIDGATAASIRTHEAGARRPVALWAVIALGVLALGLGIILVVAANWDRIPASVKLGVHWLLTAGAAASVWTTALRRRPWATEAALFLLGALVLAGIGLHAQVYQLTGPIWRSLALWAVLMTPAVLVAGSTRLTAYGLALMLLWLAMSAGLERWGETPWREGAMLALPASLILVSLLRPTPEREFERGLREAGLALLLLGASLAHFVWAVTVDGAAARAMLDRLPLPTAVTLAAAWAARRQGAPYARVVPVVLAATFLAVLIATAVPHPDDWQSRLAGAVLYGAMWAAVGKAALDAGWSGLFSLAVAAIAIRLLIVYFELFGGLAITGLGLIVAGLLMIALALGWRRIVRWRAEHERRAGGSA